MISGLTAQTAVSSRELDLLAAEQDHIQLATPVGQLLPSLQRKFVASGCKFGTCV